MAEDLDEATFQRRVLAALQAEAAARAALQYMLAHLDGTNGVPPTEEELLCEAVPVGEGLCWILGPDPDDDENHVVRIVDEASKVNLNAATVEMLMGLPGMTAELAAAIKDWRDGDSQVSQGGAESEYYLLLSDPYYCKDAPFETVDEALLVRDVTCDILYGEDTNRNGVLDPNEDDASDSDPPDNRDGHLDRGIADFVTVYSIEPNVSASGEQRVNVNSPDTQALGELLREVVPDDRYFQIMDRARRRRPFDNVLEFYFRVGLTCLLYTSPSPRDLSTSRMPSSA